jgi:glycine/D-amino acid oxidase-like deaminating enzyme
MRVGVLGGGLQGCCTALELASRGAEVTIFDKNDTLLSRAAIANEGKIHLGYMYAADPTLSTAKVMMTGALAFAPFFERHLGQSASLFATSVPATYVVHRSSQHGVDEVSAYLRAVHALLNSAAERNKGAYFEKDLSAPLRFWSASERAEKFNPEIAQLAVSTPEIAVNPTRLALNLRERLASNALIEVRCQCNVTGAEQEGERIRVAIDSNGDISQHCFDHVVNALWDGRFALNETLGYRANRPWLHRLKYGVGFRLPVDAKQPPSVTFVSGPFGEVVSYADGTVYLTWYPTCLQAISSQLVPPDWQTYPSEPLRSQIISGTLCALAEIVPLLRDLDAQNLPEVTVKGGAIVAWGKTDIYDPTSELHRRFEIGVTSEGRFHSIDPGKLTMAPYFAEVCADRIRPIG